MSNRNTLLCCSSAGFACAGVFGVSRQQISLAVTAFITFIVSFLYWMNETPGWRHKLDKSVAKCSFLIFTVYGALYVRGWWIITVGWPCWLGVIGFFGISNILYRNQHIGWIYAHALFHLCVFVGQCLVIHGISN